METRLRTYVDALRLLARSNDLNQVILVERNIDEYLQTNADQLAERFQSSNHMGCSKRPHPWDGKSKMQLCGFMESVV